MLKTTDEDWGPIQTCKSGPKVAVLHGQNHSEGWNPHRLDILVQITLFCMHKTTGDVWDSIEICYSGSKVAVYACTKPQMRAGTQYILDISGANHAVLHAQKDR